MNKIKKIIGIIIVLLIPLITYASSPATHMYIGSQTFAIWHSFDPEFETLINSDSYWGHMARKFYYIGLTLPDMIGRQEVVRAFLQKITDVNDHLNRALFVPYSVFTGANEMTFNGNSPNHNIDMMREMALWVKDNAATPFEKALVYGAYMHTIHDEFAHNVMQPSHFGYGNNIVPQFNNDGIHVAEAYYELFTQTYIPDTGWDFMRDVYSRVLDEHVGGEAPDDWWYFEPYREVNINGQEYCTFANYETTNIHGETHFRPILRFIQAAEAVVGADGTNPYAENLSYSSLKNHIHGWAMIMFFSNGYREGHESSDVGWFIRHPEWTVNDIRTKQTEMASRLAKCHNKLLYKYLGYNTAGSESRMIPRAASISTGSPTGTVNLSWICPIIEPLQAGIPRGLIC